MDDHHLDMTLRANCRRSNNQLVKLIHVRRDPDLILRHLWMAPQKCLQERSIGPKGHSGCRPARGPAFGKFDAANIALGGRHKHSRPATDRLGGLPARPTAPAIRELPGLRQHQDIFEKASPVKREDPTFSMEWRDVGSSGAAGRATPYGSAGSGDLN
jgi:hypothetical protein